MKFYVSGKIGAAIGAREVMGALTRAGHDITLDWTTLSHLRPYDQNVEYCREAAGLEVNAVKAADCLVLVVDPRGVGMWVEMGVALGQDIPVRVISRIESPSMFLHHPLVRHVRNVDEVISEFSAANRLKSM